MTTTHIPIPKSDTASAAQISKRLRPRLPPLAGQSRSLRDSLHPVQLCGSSTILDRGGVVLVERIGEVIALCGNAREPICPAC